MMNIETLGDSAVVAVHLRILMEGWMRNLTVGIYRLSIPENEEPFSHSQFGILA